MRRQLQHHQQLSSVSTSSLLLLMKMKTQTRTLTGGERSSAARSRGNPKKRGPFDTRTDPRKRNITLHQSFQQGGQSSSSTTRTPEEEFAMKSAYEQKSSITNFDHQHRSQNLLWNGVIITDHSNETVKHFMKLNQNKRYRESQKQFSQTGKNLMEEMAKKFKAFPKHLLVREDKDVPEWTNKNTEVVKVSVAVMNDMYPGNDGYVGDFEMPDPPMKEELMVNKKKFRSVLVLDNITDAGQLGSMIRLATAFSYDAVFLVNQCADLYHRDTLNSSRGVLFQKMTPIYVLKSENGDDVEAMINHVIERNDLEPLLLTPNAPKDEVELTNLDRKHELLSPIARIALERNNTNNNNKSSSKNKTKQQLESSSSSSKSNRVKTLHQLCLDSFTGWYDRTEKQNIGSRISSSSPPTPEVVSSTSEEATSVNEGSENTTNHQASSSSPSSLENLKDSSSYSSSSSSFPSSFEPKRHMLCVSRDHKGNFEQRMRSAITSKKPVTTLLLDEERPTADLVESFPVALYQLRDTARFEFLPPSARMFDEKRLAEETKKSAEPDFPHESAGPFFAYERNEPEEEFAHRIRSQKAETQQRRINQYKKSDEDVFRSWEMDKQLLDLQDGKETRGAEGDILEDAEQRGERLNRRRQAFDDKRARSPIPNPIVEQDQTIDRDVLREQEQWSETYQPPPNYYKQELKTPEWKAPKHPEEKKRARTMKQTEFYKRYDELQKQLAAEKDKKAQKFYSGLK